MATIHTTLNAGPRDADTISQSRSSHATDLLPETVIIKNVSDGCVSIFVRLQVPQLGKNLLPSPLKHNEFYVLKVYFDSKLIAVEGVRRLKDF